GGGVPRVGGDRVHRDGRCCLYDNVLGERGGVAVGVGEVELVVESAGVVCGAGVHGDRRAGDGDLGGGERRERAAVVRDRHDQRLPVIEPAVDRAVDLPLHDALPIFGGGVPRVGGDRVHRDGRRCLYNNVLGEREGVAVGVGEVE